jgi:hypothetical protein
MLYFLFEGILCFFLWVLCKLLELSERFTLKMCCDFRDCFIRAD